MKLRVRALPHGPHPFFRRAGHVFYVGGDVVDEFDEETEKLLLKEVDRLKVERVPDDTPATTPAVTPASPSPPAPGPKTELAADGSPVPMVGGAGSKGRNRS